MRITIKKISATLIQSIKVNFRWNAWNCTYYRLNVFSEFWCNSRIWQWWDKSLDPTLGTSGSGLMKESEVSLKMYLRKPGSVWGRGPISLWCHPFSVILGFSKQHLIFCICHCLQRVRKQYSVCHFSLSVLMIRMCNWRDWKLWHSKWSLWIVKTQAQDKSFKVQFLYTGISESPPFVTHSSCNNHCYQILVYTSWFLCLLKCWHTLNTLYKNKNSRKFLYMAIFAYSYTGD